MKSSRSPRRSPKGQAVDRRRVRDVQAIARRCRHRHLQSPRRTCGPCVPRPTCGSIFQRRRSSACARGSVLRCSWAASRSSLRKLARRTVGQAAVRDRCPDRAAGLGVMAAIAEAAGRGEAHDIVERGVDALVGPGHLERPDARRVDEHGPARQLEQLAMGGRVSAAGVVVADLARRLALLAEERVDERGLADARRPEHDRGLARPARYGARSSRWSPVRAESVTIGTPGAIASTATPVPRGPRRCPSCSGR